MKRKILHKVESAFLAILMLISVMSGSIVPVLALDNNIAQPIAEGTVQKDAAQQSAAPTEKEKPVPSAIPGVLVFKDGNEISAPPVANLASGEVEIGTELVLSTPLISKTPENPADIYYTTDGSEPTSQAPSIAYLSPIVIDKPVTIKAVVIDDTYNKSEAITLSFTVKATEAAQPPVTQDNAVPTPPANDALLPVAPPANDAVLPVAPTADASISTIADARKLEKGKLATVEGIVTMVDKQNVYIQDATAGICVRLKALDDTIKLGNTLKAQGKLGEYNSLKQLNIANNADIKVINTVSELPAAKLITLSDLANKETAESLESQRVKIKDVVIDPLVTDKTSVITDKNGVKANIYGIGEITNLKNGSTIISINAIVSQHKENYQLRIADPSDVELPLAPAEKPKPIKISEARILKAYAEATVEGVVTMVDGYDVFIENASDAGICVNM
ncbi:MAG: chitobiase/beta-hexosaminidase C-terminal domain-containing protein, partial [Christensenella sp.]